MFENLMTYFVAGYLFQSFGSAFCCNLPEQCSRRPQMPQNHRSCRTIKATLAFYISSACRAEQSRAESERGRERGERKRGKQERQRESERETERERAREGGREEGGRGRMTRFASARVLNTTGWTGDLASHSAVKGKFAYEDKAG